MKFGTEQYIWNSVCHVTKYEIFKIHDGERPPYWKMLEML